jgi:hypothetical protein
MALVAVDAQGHAFAAVHTTTTSQRRAETPTHYSIGALGCSEPLQVRHVAPSVRLRECIGLPSSAACAGQDPMLVADQDSPGGSDYVAAVLRKISRRTHSRHWQWQHDKQRPAQRTGFAFLT